jgi:hypothetical protein
MHRARIAVLATVALALSACTRSMPGADDGGADVADDVYTDSETSTETDATESSTDDDTETGADTGEPIYCCTCDGGCLPSDTTVECAGESFPLNQCATIGASVECPIECGGTTGESEGGDCPPPQEFACCPCCPGEPGAECLPWDGDVGSCIIDYSLFVGCPTSMTPSDGCVLLSGGGYDCGSC